MKHLSRFSFCYMIYDFMFARLVEENGAAIILKNNPPRYVLIEFSQFQEEAALDDDAVDAIAKRILKKHQAAFEELAK